jgi:hypothetical protein
MSSFTLVHAVIFAMLAAFHIWIWARRGFWIPRYVHVLAVIALGLGLATVWSLQQQGPGKPAATSFLLVVMFPAIVYVVFVLYGGVVAAPRVTSRKRPEPDDGRNPTHPLGQQKPFDDIEPRRRNK